MNDWDHAYLNTPPPRTPEDEELEHTLQFIVTLLAVAVVLAVVAALYITCGF